MNFINCAENDKREYKFPFFFRFFKAILLAILRLRADNSASSMKDHRLLKQISLFTISLIIMTIIFINVKIIVILQLTVI